MKRILIISLFCALSVAHVSGQSLTLAECHASAIEHNRTLKNSRLEVSAATQSRKEAFTHYFPQLSASGGAFQATHGILQADFTLPEMGTLPISLVKKGVTGAVTAVQPLFAGMKIVNANKLARVGEDISRLQLQQSEAEVREKTETYFWQVVQLYDQLATLDAVEKQLQEIYRQVELSVKAGMATKNDLLRVELRQQEVASGRLKAENGLNISRMMLANHIGVAREGFDIRYEDASVQVPSDYYLSTDEAVERRVEYQLAAQNLKVHQYQTQLTRANYLPTVGIGAGYLYYNVMDKNVGEGLVFAQVSVPLSGWWGGSHALKKARIKEQKAENDRFHAKDMLALDVEKAWGDLCEAYAQITLAEKSVASSTENLRQNSHTYQAGIIPLSDLLDAETIYAQSLNNLTSVKAAYRTAIAHYLRVTGR